MAIGRAKAAFDRRIVAEIGAVVFNIHSTSFFQIAAPTLTILYLSFVLIAAFVRLKRAGTATFRQIGSTAYRHARAWLAFWNDAVRKFGRSIFIKNLV